MTSAVAAEKIRNIIQKQVDKILNDSNVRETLNTNIHILDLSFNAVFSANEPQVEEDLNKKYGRKKRQDINFSSYTEFLETIKSLTTAATSVQKAIDLINSSGRASVKYLYIGSDGQVLLVCKNFDAARTIISAVSNIIPNNPNFGKTLRETTFNELADQYAIDDLDNINEVTYQRLKDKAFIQSNGWIGRIVLNKLTETYAYEEVRKLGNFKYVAIRNNLTKQYEIRSSRECSGDLLAMSSSNTIKMEEVVAPDERHLLLPVIGKTELSVLDIGHAFRFNTDSKSRTVSSRGGGRTPAGDKLIKLFNMKDTAIKQIARKYIQELNDIHSAINFEWHNLGAEGDLSSSTKKAGYVVLTVQHHKANNALAIHEGAIIRNIANELKKAILTIPGSNSLEDDIKDGLANKILSLLGGVKKKIAKHTPVKGSVKVPSVKITADSRSINGPTKTITKISSTTKPLQLRNTTGQFTSLVSLQNILNQNLHTQIQKNMGTGDRRDILNYRTGRFAESAKVEKMSQSREGMITAFYSYMRNPYATFSTGGEQANPATRDPKLLISKSIREIGATMVANRMRAVLV